MDIVILILLTLGIVSVTISWLKADLKCPPPTIVYKYIPKHTLDVQFSETPEENMPSTIYKDLFTSGTPWIGGYTLGTKGIVTPTSGNAITTGTTTTGTTTTGTAGTLFIQTTTAGSLVGTTTTTSQPAGALETTEPIITR